MCILISPKALHNAAQLQMLKFVPNRAKQWYFFKLWTTNNPYIKRHWPYNVYGVDFIPFNFIGLFFFMLYVGGRPLKHLPFLYAD